MDQVTISIRRIEYTDNLETLPPQFERDGLVYNIHTTPRVTYQCGEHPQLTKNFDLLLDFIILNPDPYTEALLGSCYRPHRRKSKTEQLLTVSKAINTLSPVYQTYFEHPRHHCTLGMEGPLKACGAGVSGRFVVKEENGARGDGQAIIPAHLASTFLTDPKRYSETREVLAAKYPSVVFSQKPTEGPFFPGHGEMMVTDYVEDVKTEWRLMVGGETVLGYQRRRKEGDYPQANLDGEGPHPAEPIELKTLSELLPGEQGKAVYRLIKALGLTLGSVDLYLTEEGKLGVFEYCPQFGYYGIDPNQIQRLHEDFIVHEVKTILGSPEPPPSPTPSTRYDLAT